MQLEKASSPKYSKVHLRPSHSIIVRTCVAVTAVVVEQQSLRGQTIVAADKIGHSMKHVSSDVSIRFWYERSMLGLDNELLKDASVVVAQSGQ